MFGNLGSGFEKQVPGFYFQKPGYPGRVSGFQKCTKLTIFGWKNRHYGAFWSKNMQISLEIAKLALFGPENGDYYDFLWWFLAKHSKNAYICMFIKNLKKNIYLLLFLIWFHQICICNLLFNLQLKSPKKVIFSPYLGR